MKVDRAAREEMAQPSSIATNMPLYPWGLSVNLDTDSLEKLEIDAADLEIGSSLMLVAKVEIVSLSSNESKDGGANQNVSLQITDMCLEKNTKDAAAALYAKK